MYCNYQGFSYKKDDINFPTKTEEEFRMLTEPEWHSNFKDMFTAIMYIVGCSQENQKCRKALRDPKCKISRYAQNLVELYQDSNILIEDHDVIKMLKILEKIVVGEHLEN